MRKKIRKKKINRIGIVITPRDAEVFINIASKPLTLSEIRNLHFKHRGRTSSRPAASRRLSKLARFGYLCKTLKNGVVQFTLGESGTEYLSEKLGYDKNKIKIVKEKSFFITKKRYTRGNRISITRRDEKIFGILASGPATFATLRKLFTKTDGILSTKQNVFKRLQKLSCFGYLQKVIYPSNPSILYYIGEMGAEYLVNTLNYESERIRMNPVKREEVAHELLITEIVRKIKDEEDRLMYKVLFLHDDHYMRMFSSRKKGVLFPDLYLSIQDPEGVKVVYRVEVDSGKRSARALVTKILNYTKNILIITLTSGRRATLQKAIMNTSDALINRTFLALFADIVREGFVECRGWKGPDKVPAELI